MGGSMLCFLFFFNDTATTEIYTLSLHDALPISVNAVASRISLPSHVSREDLLSCARVALVEVARRFDPSDRKSTRLNSSHANISYAVFCLKKKQTSS